MKTLKINKEKLISGYLLGLESTASRCLLMLNACYYKIR